MAGVVRGCLVLAVIGLVACKSERFAPSPNSRGSSTGSALHATASVSSAPAQTTASVSPPPAASHEVTLMNYQERFTAVERQLIELPDSSDAILSRAMRGEAFRPPLGGEEAVFQSISHDMFTFRTPYTIPKAVHRVAFSRENGGIDVVRLRYRAGRYVLTVSHSRNVLAVSVRGFQSEPNETPLAVANRAARELFAAEVPKRFVHLGAPEAEPDGVTAFGCQRSDLDVAAMRRRADWTDRLCWWMRPDEVGFITLKLKTGNFGYGKGFVSPQVRENANWFRP